MLQLPKAITNWFAKEPIWIPAAVLGGLLATGMVVAVVIHSQTQLVLARDEVTVKGVAYQDVEADFGTWEISLAVTRADRQSSLQEMERQQKIIMEYLAGFTYLTLEPGIPRTLERYEYEDSKRVLKGYESTIAIKATSTQVDQVFANATAFNTFAVQNNLDIQSNTTAFTYSKLDTLKLKLLEAAVADAQNRAKALGASSKTKIGKVKNASQGVFQVNARNSFDVSDGGNFNTESKDKTVQATVEITFEVL